MNEITVEEYDARWPAQFAQLAERVKNEFAPGMLLSIEHVGSTSIYGLASKPVIDIDVVIPSASDLPQAIACLAKLGYAYEGDNGVTGRAAFRWPEGEARHHLYVMAQDNGELRRHLAFRDYLRSHPGDAAYYARLKRDLAQQFRDDRVAYNDGKTEFVQAVLEKARQNEY